MLNKSELLEMYRYEVEICFQSIKNSLSPNDKAKIINNKIQNLRNSCIVEITKNSSSCTEQLNDILLTTYLSYVIMLEFRNKVWEYEYMAFSRRIGEIWEPFCKLPFEFPVNELTLYEPPKFNFVQKTLEEKIHNYIDGLSINNPYKLELLDYYQQVWNLVDSGSISLTLDLHFMQNDILYDVDYKSGFSSNEKGNTNRLLMVASIYKSLPEQHKNLMFVRQYEEDNNHYLQTLKNSQLWDVYCADAAYEKIKEFSGFDLKAWMNLNMNWKEDISSEFRDFLYKRNLLRYLTW